MLLQLKRAILAKAGKQRLAALQNANGSLVEHFEATLASFRIAAQGKPEHDAMDGYITTMLDNLKITTLFLVEQKAMLEGDAP
jgi:hypothetical protein